jgi:hypothetical protein
MSSDYSCRLSTVLGRLINYSSYIVIFYSVEKFQRNSMMNKAPLETTKCNNPTNYKISLAPDIESIMQISVFIEKLSDIIFSEYYRTIIFAGVQVTNTIRSLEYFYPSLKDGIISQVKTMTGEITNILNSYHKKLRSLFNAIHFNQEPDNEIPVRSNVNMLLVYKAYFLESIGVNKSKNHLKFIVLNTRIRNLNESTRSQIGKVALKFQEDNFINQKVKEIYYG